MKYLSNNKISIFFVYHFIEIKLIFFNLKIDLKNEESHITNEP